MVKWPPPPETCTKESGMAVRIASSICSIIIILSV
jgi:hypothetical protein